MPLGGYEGAGGTGR